MGFENEQEWHLSQRFFLDLKTPAGVLLVCASGAIEEGLEGLPSISRKGQLCSLRTIHSLLRNSSEFWDPHKNSLLFEWHFIQKGRWGGAEGSPPGLLRDHSVWKTPPGLCMEGRSLHYNLQTHKTFLYCETKYIFNSLGRRCRGKGRYHSYKSESKVVEWTLAMFISDWGNICSRLMPWGWSCVNPTPIPRIPPVSQPMLTVSRRMITGIPCVLNMHWVKNVNGSPHSGKHTEVITSLSNRNIHLVPFHKPFWFFYHPWKWLQTLIALGSTWRNVLH